MHEPMSGADRSTVTAQLQRPPRDVAGIAYRCPCGRPAVVATQPRLADGTPFPTTYYLTCPRASAACSTLESNGVMAEMAQRLRDEPEVAEGYRRAHASYLADRARLGEVPEIDQVSAGGMPDRVKCLHALAAHALAAGPGVNPFGDEALAAIGDFWAKPCLPDPPNPRGESMSPPRVAAIDCGTNSIRLLLAESDGADGLVDLDRRTEIVRLGQGVDATGEFHPDALVRTFAATERYAELVAAADIPVENIHFVATSASRDARNREEFFAGIEQRLGVRPDIITGDTEAQLSFSGALSRSHPGGDPVLVMDIGGGSTELIVGSTSGDLHSAISLDIGSVRLTERFLKTSPPFPAGLIEASAYVDGLLDSSGVDFARIGSWIGVAGTATTLAGVYLQLETYERERVHNARLPRPELDAMLERLSGLTVAEIRALPSMHPNRADVVTAGTLIATRVGARLGVGELIVSESDILDGIALTDLRRLAPAG